MTKYVVGMDGGGTKTHVLIMDIHGNTLHSFQSGAINYNGESAQNVDRNLKELLNEIKGLTGDLAGCASMCIGMAGISNANAVKNLTQTVRDNGYGGQLDLLGDHETALYGALGRADGIIIIAGTGSICYGKNINGESYRSGGYGYLIDDEGSGYAIGRDILSAVVRAHDGRIGFTLLTEMVFEALRISSIQELLGFVYSKETNKRNIAALSPILSKACLSGDAAANDILDKCTTELTRLVNTVANKLWLTKADLALAGSVLIKDELIRNRLISKIKSAFPDINPILPKENASFGAASMALKSIHLSVDECVTIIP